jgi:hypothetical protein
VTEASARIIVERKRARRPRAVEFIGLLYQSKNRKTRKFGGVRLAANLE